MGWINTRDDAIQQLFSGFICLVVFSMTRRFLQTYVEGEIYGIN
jgi:hypothetical protein